MVLRTQACIALQTTLCLFPGVISLHVSLVFYIISLVPFAIARNTTPRCTQSHRSRAHAVTRISCGGDSVANLAHRIVTNPINIRLAQSPHSHTLCAFLRFCHSKTRRSHRSVHLSQHAMFYEFLWTEQMWRYYNMSYVRNKIRSGIAFEWPLRIGITELHASTHLIIVRRIGIWK